MKSISLPRNKISFPWNKISFPRNKISFERKKISFEWNVFRSNEIISTNRKPTLWFSILRYYFVPTNYISFKRNTFRSRNEILFRRNKILFVRMKYYLEGTKSYCEGTKSISFPRNTFRSNEIISKNCKPCPFRGSVISCLTCDTRHVILCKSK